MVVDYYLPLLGKKSPAKDDRPIYLGDSLTTLSWDTTLLYFQNLMSLGMLDLFLNKTRTLSHPHSAETLHFNLFFLLSVWISPWNQKNVILTPDDFNLLSLSLPRHRNSQNLWAPIMSLSSRDSSGIVLKSQKEILLQRWRSRVKENMLLIASLRWSK